ncbi:MAG: hypothetical protein ACLSX5_13755 [Lachnospiraceae bacterium]
MIKGKTDITIEDRELQELVYQKVLAMRRMLFDLCTEDYPYMPKVISKWRRGKKVVILSENEWNRYNEDIATSMGDLMTAREMIAKMEPVYREFHEEYEQKHKVSFDEYMQQMIVDYDADEFEQVRERFEKEYYKQLEDEEECI